MIDISAARNIFARVTKLNELEADREDTSCSDDPTPTHWQRDHRDWRD